MQTESAKVRLDKWLWAARFFKTRTLAAEAVAGDLLRIRKGPYEFVVLVKGLSSQRGPAKVSVMLYEETSDSRATREKTVELHRLSALATPHTDKRPNKKQRRQISRFIGKGASH